MLGGDVRRPLGTHRGGQVDGLRQRQQERAAVIGRNADMNHIMAGPQGASRWLMSINRVGLATQKTALAVGELPRASSPRQPLQAALFRRSGRSAFSLARVAFSCSASKISLSAFGTNLARTSRINGW